MYPSTLLISELNIDLKRLLGTPTYVPEHIINLAREYFRFYNKHFDRLDLIEFITKDGQIERTKIKRILETLRSKMISELKKRNIVIESCPTSNMVITWQLGEHPLECFLKEGLRVVIGTDDPMVLNTDILSELALAKALRTRSLNLTL